MVATSIPPWNYSWTGNVRPALIHVLAALTVAGSNSSKRALEIGWGCAPPNSFTVAETTLVRKLRSWARDGAGAATPCRRSKYYLEPSALNSGTRSSRTLSWTEVVEHFNYAALPDKIERSQITVCYYHCPWKCSWKIFRYNQIKGVDNVLFNKN